MKQLETANQKLISNVISLYREIGIDILINNAKVDDKNFFSTSKHKDNNKDSHKTLDKKKKIKELEYEFKNFDGCRLKKTSTNFVKFFWKY